MDAAFTFPKDKRLSFGIWPDRFPPKCGPVLIENNTELYYFITYDERGKNEHEPVVFEDADGFSLVCPPEENRPIVFEKDIKRIVPDDPMHRATVFSQAYEERTRRKPFAVPAPVQAYWDSINKRLHNLAGREHFLEGMQDIPEIRLVQKEDYDGRDLPLAAIQYRPAEHALRTIEKAAGDGLLAVLPCYKNSVIDSLLTQEIFREETAFEEYLQEALHALPDAAQYLARRLPRPGLFREWKDVQDDFNNAIDGKEWIASYEAFAYGLESSFRGWMFEVAKDVMPPGGILIAPGHYKYVIDLLRERLENPTIDRLLSKRPGLPTMYFTDIGRFPALDVTVYGRKDEGLLKKVLRG